MSYEKCCSNLRRHSCYCQKRLPGRLLRVPRAVAPSPGRRAAGGTIWVPVAGVRDGERCTCLGVRSPGLNSSVATSGPVTGQLAEHCELFTRTLWRGCSLQVGVLPVGGRGQGATDAEHAHCACASVLAHLGLRGTRAQPSAVRPEARVAPRGAEAFGAGAAAREWAGARGQRRRAAGTSWQAGPFAPRWAHPAAKSGFRRDEESQR